MITAIIPARGNSKEIEGKNLAEVDPAGNTLLSYAVVSANNAKLIDSVIVSSEDRDIREYVNLLSAAHDTDKIMSAHRPDELSQDYVQVDEVVLYTLRQLYLASRDDTVFSPPYPDTVVVLQPTSPFRTAQHVDEAIELYQLINSKKKPWEEKEIVFSAYEPGPTYEVDDDGKARSYLFDPRLRLGRQDAPDTGYAVENGAIYVVDAKMLSQKRSFRARRMQPYWMGKWESLEIDSQEDLFVARALMERSYESDS